MKDCTGDILDAALTLAERGGFDRVRQRDVAAKAGVALGTLYKRFRSKEGILVAVMARDADVLDRKLDRRPPEGATGEERVAAFFAVLTRTLCDRPQYGRAVIRAMACGVPEVTTRITAY